VSLTPGAIPARSDATSISDIHAVIESAGSRDEAVASISLPDA
jgi:hypothetical protein